jgi:hypothetical protein
MHRKVVYFGLLSFALESTTRAEFRPCYFLDGTISNNSWPCNNATTGHSTCCQPGATCYSNGVCEWTWPRGVHDWLRVGCTDETWDDPACLKRCVKSKYTLPPLRRRPHKVDTQLTFE